MRVSNTGSFYLSVVKLVFPEMEKETLLSNCGGTYFSYLHFYLTNTRSYNLRKIPSGHMYVNQSNYKSYKPKPGLQFFEFFGGTPMTLQVLQIWLHAVACRPPGW